MKDVVAYLTKADEGAGSCAGSCDGSDLLETLPDTLQTALKDRPKSFSIRLARSLEKWVDVCFGEENFKIEKKLDTRRNIGLWRVVPEVPEVLPATHRKNSEIEINTKNSGNNFRHFRDRDIAPTSVEEQNGSPSHSVTICLKKEEAPTSGDQEQLPELATEWEEFDL